MEYHNEQERYIAILEASLPYVAPQSRHAIQLLLITFFSTPCQRTA